MTKRNQPNSDLITKVKIPITAIDSNTHISFGVKSFIALIGTILGIFVGFYELAIAPKLDMQNNNYNEVRAEVSNLNTSTYNGFISLNQCISKIDENVNNLTLTINGIRITQGTMKTNQNNILDKEIKINNKIKKNSSLDSISKSNNFPSPVFTKDNSNSPFINNVLGH
jgi:hypothetical protein